jgi:hypothetical protein
MKYLELDYSDWNYSQLNFTLGKYLTQWTVTYNRFGLKDLCDYISIVSYDDYIAQCH